MPFRVLVPFDNLAQLQETLCKAIELAEKLAAELIVLRVNSPGKSSQMSSGEAQLYRELKALQAQCASFPIPLRIEAMAGPMEQAILSFAAAEGIDLIVSTHMSYLLSGAPKDALGPEVAASGRVEQTKMPYWQSAPGIDENHFAAAPIPEAVARPLP